ncbi:MAG: DUF1552 domain-containing protein [Verrucomicrobiales bacterium]|nr:DUF1552 domain-containing protein [Verrucomicrobiales bacterium]
MNTQPVDSPAVRRPFPLSRRSFLRGLGAGIALPTLASMPGAPAGSGPVRAAARATTAAGTPLRSVFVFFPNGAIPSEWWPADGSAATPSGLSRTLEPLEPVRRHVQLVAGLDNLAANPGPDGAGDHARGNGTFLTCVRLRKSSTDLRAGTSIDQLIAGQVGSLTRLPSLELTCDHIRKSSGCDSGYSCAYQFNISWRNATTPMTAENNPRLVFERLFGAGSPGERAANRRRRQQEQRSVLDFVLEDARALQRRLDARDREKLDQYLTGLREVEERITRAERFPDVRDPGVDTPAGIPGTHGEHIQLMNDLLVLALQTDTTRVATLQLSYDGSNRSFSEIGIAEGHHDLTHHQNRPDWIRKVAEIDRWYVAQFAQLLQKLEAVQEVDGHTLLHNSMVTYGSGNADGNRHTHSNLPVLLAGGGGGTLTPGRTVHHGSRPLANLYLSLADRMGLAGLERFGDSTGRLPDI